MSKAESVLSDNNSYIFFPIYFDILDESNVIYLCKCGFGRERNSIWSIWCGSVFQHSV